MQRHFSMLYGLPVLQLARPECKKFTGFGSSVVMVLSKSSISTVKVRQPAKHHKINHQQRQENRRPTSRLTDPIRPVSDRLLVSLMKRHKEKFSGLSSSHESMSATVLPSVSAPGLIHIIYSIPQDASWKTDHLRNVERLLTKCLYKMSLEQALQACHGFYLQEHSFHQFLSQMLSVVDETFNDLSLSTGEITRLLFYVFIHGSAPAMLLHRVEEYLLKRLDEFHINDLAVVCVGFFRGNSRLSSQDLLDAIAKKLLADIDLLEPFLLVDFLKMFRHASYIKVSFYEQLADCLVKSNIMTAYTTVNPVMHIAFTYASIPVRHIALFEHLFNHAERLLSRQKYIRTKDVSKFVWACGTLQFRPENCEARYGQLIKSFETNSRDNRDFPESIAELLTGLVYLGFFPKGLLHKCLSPEVATKLLESGADREKSIQLLLLNETVKMECADYTGNLVSQSVMKVLQQHPSVQHDLETELETRVGLRAVVSCLQGCLGDDCVQCHRPFIHFKTAVIELWYSEEHGFLKISPSTTEKSASNQTDTFTQRAVTDDLYLALTKRSEKPHEPGLPSKGQRLAIVVSSSNQFALNDHVHPLGHLHTLTRQLDKAGYTVVQIFPEDALQLELSSHEERCCHLSAVLSSAFRTSIILS